MRFIPSRRWRRNLTLTSQARWPPVPTDNLVPLYLRPYHQRCTALWWHPVNGNSYRINRKRIQRLMRLMGLGAIYPKRRTSRPHPDHKVYPYLLRSLKIDRPNQVWATDITYVPMARGFMYLVAVMDWNSRKVLSWRLSNSSISKIILIMAYHIIFFDGI